VCPSSRDVLVQANEIVASWRRIAIRSVLSALKHAQTDEVSLHHNNFHRVLSKPLQSSEETTRPGARFQGPVPQHHTTNNLVNLCQIQSH
jgi:hypothetical protein